MQALSLDIKRNKYIMRGIDIYIKLPWAIPIKNKSGKEILTALQELFKVSMSARA